MKNKILLIGDSFGCERFNDKNNIVAENETFPELIKNYFNNENLEIESDFKPFRLLTEAIDIINKKNKKYDLIIVHAGIVDIFPRPLPKKIFRSRNIIAKILRKIISYFRLFWLMNIYAKPMNDIVFLEKKIDGLLCNYQNTEFLFVTATKQFHEEAIKTPKAEYFINSFNEMLLVKSNKKDNITLLDLTPYSSIQYYSSFDSHFNKEGNKLMLNLISTFIENKCL